MGDGDAAMPDLGKPGKRHAAAAAGAADCVGLIVRHIDRFLAKAQGSQADDHEHEVFGMCARVFAEGN